MTRAPDLLGLGAAAHRAREEVGRVLMELTAVEQRYDAVNEVIAEGLTVTEVAVRYKVSRQTVHEWLARASAGGLRV